MARSKVAVRPLVVAAHPHNNSLVVLIHGILSSRFRAWESVVDMIQEVFDKGRFTSTFGSYDYYAFGYRSGLLQPPFEEYFDALRRLVSKERYETVILIGHSQGGVLAKLFMLDELAKNRLGASKVDIIITLDTPHKGPQPWIYPVVLLGALWKRVPVLGRRWPFWRQAADLARWSPALRKLAREWTLEHFPQSPCAPAPRRRYLQSFTVQGTRLPIPWLRPKAVVGAASAEGFAIDQPMDDDRKTAWDLGHGVASMHRFRFRTEQILSNHGEPALGELCEKVGSLDASAISDVVREACDSASLPCELEAWLRRLRLGFRARPLRGLTSPAEAARKFITIRRAHP